MESDIRGFKYLLYHSLALGPWASDPTSLGLIAPLGSECFQGSKKSRGELDDFRKSLTINSGPHPVLSKQFTGIISFQTHNHLDTRTLFLQLRRERQRGSTTICLRSQGWKRQEQGLELKSIWCNIRCVPRKLGFSYRSRSGRQAPPSPTSFCLFHYWCHWTQWGRWRSF